MKKVFSILVVFLMLITLVGCGSSEPDFEFESALDDFEISDVETYEAPDNKMELGSIGNVDLGLDVETYEANDVKIDLEPLGEYAMDIVNNINSADAAKIGGLDEEAVKALVETKTNMLNTLEKEFDKAGIDVEIDEKSGEISMDSGVLFGGDSAVLSDEGKDFLKKFISTYSSVILSDEYDGFISRVLVEGHIAPISGSTYESGLPLSEERAENVMNYCLSNKTGLSDGDVKKLSNIFEAVGLSNTQPVKDSSGNVDLDASRRVTFRFFVNID